MIIKDATNTDINGIVGLIREFSHALPLNCATEALSPQKVVIIVQEAMSLGLVKIALNTDDMGLVGVVLGIVSLNVWSMHAKEIQMLAIYVKPEHRNSSAGGRLFKSYLDATNKLMDEHPEIQGSHVFEQPEGTNINYKKRGFKFLQSQYTKER